jgi:CubicO group peptidase (beta-lactamase class C family)
MILPTLRIIAAGAIALLAVAARPEAVAAADLGSPIAKLFAPLADGKAGRGIVVGVVTKDGRRVYRFGDPAIAGKASDDDIIFEIGSVTKVFTALVLADMAAEKSVNLSDPVQLYLPKETRVPKSRDAEITLLHLATHTSGLPRLPPYFVLHTLTHAKNPYAHYGTKELNAALAACEPDHEPGTHEEYSNLGVGLLGDALFLRAGAKSYDDLVVRRICEPLGLKDTRVTLSVEQRARLAQGYDAAGAATPHWDFQTMEGAGALRSSANDMLAFLEATLGRRETKLRPAMELCRQRHRIPGGKDLSLPLGWVKGKPTAGGPVYWHNGGTGGFHSYVAFVKEAGIGVVVLSNSAEYAKDGQLERAGRTVLDLLNDSAK